MNRPLLVNPPLVGYAAGPSLGVANLVAVGTAVGVDVEVLDLNALFVNPFIDDGEADATAVVGDHAKPVGGVRRARDAWHGLAAEVLGAPVGQVPAGDDAVSSLFFDMERVQSAADRLASGPIGRHWQGNLPRDAPPFVGVTVGSPGQVLAALAVSALVKKQWPDAPVIWGGSLVTLLAPAIAMEPSYGAYVDGFVRGYAEATFADICRRGPRAVQDVFVAGGGRAPWARGADVVPCFRDLELYGRPRLTLPVQSSRGCAHGRCAFCTHPTIERRYEPLSLEAVRMVFAVAPSLRAEVAVKDAFVLPRRLDAIAAVAQGRVAWSACTRLVPRLGRRRIERLAEAGLRTLEVGLETTDPVRSARLGKPQRLRELDDLLADAAGLDIHVIVNVILGHPGESASEAAAALTHLEEELPARFPATRFSTERNLLQIQRGTPMAERPGAYGIRLGRPWPWAASLHWDAPDWRASLGANVVGFHEGAIR